MEMSLFGGTSTGGKYSCAKRLCRPIIDSSPFGSNPDSNSNSSWPRARRCSTSLPLRNIRSSFAFAMSSGEIGSPVLEFFAMTGRNCSSKIQFSISCETNSEASSSMFCAPDKLPHSTLASMTVRACPYSWNMATTSFKVR